MSRTSQKIGYAFALLPATALAVQNLIMEQSESRDQDPLEMLVKKAETALGVKPKEIITLDAAIPLILMGGIALPKITTLFGVTYIAGKVIYKTKKSDKELKKVGKLVMQGSLAVLAGTALVATMKFFIDK